MSRKEKLKSETKLKLVEQYLKGEISQAQASNEVGVAYIRLLEICVTAPRYFSFGNIDRKQYSCLL